MMKKSTLKTATLASFMSLALLPVATLSHAKSAKSSDDMLGTYKIISTKYGTERAVIQCKKDKRGAYYFQVTKLLNKGGVDFQTTCQNCPGKFKKKPINGMIVAWNFKPSKTNPYRYMGGYGIDPWSGRMFQGKMKLNNANDIIRIKASPLGTKLVSRSFYFIKAK